MEKNLSPIVALLLLAGLFVIFGYTAEANPFQKETSKQGSLPLSREDAIRETVFKYQIERMTSALQQKGVVFFLSVDENAYSSDRLIERFAGHRPPVKNVSESVSKEYEGIFDKETGKKGVLFYVTSIKWISETEAEVEGGVYTAPLEASSHIYKVRFENGKWAVKDDDTKWISQLVIAVLQCVPPDAAKQSSYDTL